MTRPPCVRLYPACPGNPRLRIEGESPQSGKDIRSPLMRATTPEICLPPAAVQPQPLLGMFAHPAFDDVVDLLRHALDVDASVSLTHRRDFLGEFGAKTVSGQAD